MIIGNKTFENYTYVMAILNLTCDSFYPSSRVAADEVLFRAEKAIKDGAAVLDVGAQSTRPDYKEVSAQEELARLEKPLIALKRNFDIPVSVDTYYNEVARVALDIGADMINDVWGLSRSENMAKTIADKGASVCIMHNSEHRLTGDIFSSVFDFLKQAVCVAKDAGISPNKICLDGGIGFAKDKSQNFELLNGYERLSTLGFPLLLGASRKSMFGGDVGDRLAPTLESTRLAVRKGVLFVRVHDVKENFIVIEREYGR